MTMPAPDDWSYSGDPTASDLDEVRFWLQDTDPNVRLLANAEIDFLIGTWKVRYNGSLIYVAAVAAEVISFKFAGVPAIDADGVSVAMDRVSPAYAELAGQLRGLYNAEQTGAEVDISNLMWAHGIDPTLAPLRFGVGTMDNAEAGLQDYGGLNFASWWGSFDSYGYPGW